MRSHQMAKNRLNKRHLLSAKIQDVARRTIQPKDHFGAFQGNKVLRQYVATLMDDDSANEEQQLSETLEEGFIILADRRSQDPKDNGDSSFLHLASVDEENTPASFVAKLQSI